MDCRSSSKVRILPGRRGIFPGLFAAAILLLLCAAAHAEKRVALVIGNGAYRALPALPNPLNDARDVGQTMRKLGFETIVATDLDRAGMNDALDRFSRLVPGADMALVYYSGHGMQFQGNNYLLPIDVRLDSAQDVNRFRLMPVDDVLEVLRTASGARVLVLDACRNNPVEEDLKRRLAMIPGASRDAALTRGFSRISAGNGLIVAYATQANDVASDGFGHNSPFTSAFLKNAPTPDIDLREMFFRVQDDVDQQTNGQQRPELSISLVGRFKLIAAPPGAASQSSSSVANPRPPVAVDATTLANLQPAPPAAPDEPDDNAELKDTKLLFEVRERLYELNFDPGPLAGSRPDLTRAAIAQFARATSTALREQPTYGLLRKLRAISNPKPWGAIVYAEGVNVWGMSWAEATRKDAVAHAAASCGSNAAACTAETSFFGAGCAAFAHSKKAWALVARGTIAKAKSDAIEECSRKGSGCNIIASVCADGTEQFTAK
jgi:uncharacterized caspase-like protein